MATVRQVTSKIKAAPKPEKVSSAAAAPKVEKVEATEEKLLTAKTKKTCQFCDNKTEPKYTDVQALRRFMNDRGRISPRARSGNCAKHQRRVAREIKHARHLALLPFVVAI